MPPNFMLILAGLLKIFPDSILTARYLNVVSFYFSAVLFYLILKRFKLSETFCILSFALVLWEPLLFRFGAAGRMEGVTALFFFLSLYCVTFESNKSFLSILSGFFVGMSFLSHPFGASLGLVPFMWIIITKSEKFKNTLLFGIGVIFPILFWITYIHPDWELFLIQFGSQLTRKRTLFESFTILDKIKVFAYGFTFSKIKLAVFGTTIVYNGFISASAIKKTGHISKILTLFWIWISVVVLSLYSSSEGWYVVHSLFPLALGIAYLYFHSHFGKFITIFALVLSYSGILYNNYTHWQKTNSEVILTEHFSKINNILEHSHNVYLQAIPDPYFYLRKVNPNLKLFEFIPGELEIPSLAYQNTIKNMDAFLFYDERLMNQTILTHIQSSKNWKKFEWEIPVPNHHWLHYKTTIFIKIKN